MFNPSYSLFTLVGMREVKVERRWWWDGWMDWRFRMVFGRDGMVETWWDETMMTMMIFDYAERESQQQIANSWW